MPDTTAHNSAADRAFAFAPASMANLGIGFDILGLALDEPGDTVIAETCDIPGVTIASVEGDEGRLPLDADKNSASVAAQAVLQAVGSDQGVALRIHKGLPLGSGLGSSAASAVAAAVAVNALLGNPLSKADLLAPALEGEAVVSGYHADNIAPALLGGIVLIGGTDITALRHLPVPDTLHLAVITPDVTVLTREARAVLPQAVPLKTMIAQTAGVAQLIDALYRGDIQAAAAAMERDNVVEPSRAHLMPLLAEARTTAKRAGALGLVISGAGPTLAAVCDSAEISKAVARALCALYTEAGIGATARAARVNMDGARVLETAPR